MPNPAPFVSKQGAFALYAGEARTITLSIIDAEGTTLDLTGRSFALVAFSYRDRTEILNVGTVARGDSLTIGLTGEQTELLYGASLAAPLGMELLEVLEDGVSPILRPGPLSMLIRGAGGLSVAPTVVPGAPITQINYYQAEQDLLVSQQGASGLSAFQLLVLEGIISEPTAQAFSAWITGLVTAAFPPNFDFSDPNNSQNLG